MSDLTLGVHPVAPEANDNDKSLVSSADNLGQAHWPVDVALGSLAFVPLIGFAALSVFPTGLPSTIVRTLAVIWAACLLAFFSGVRRGLSFSQQGGATAGQIAAFLTVFFLAVLSLLLCSPGIAAFGLLFVGGLDVLSARRREAPHYFARLRPIQVLFGAAALGVVQWRMG